MGHSVWFDHRQGELQHSAQAASRHQHLLHKSMFLIEEKKNMIKSFYEKRDGKLAGYFNALQKVPMPQTHLVA